MEFPNLYQSLWAILALVLWSINFWGFFKKAQLYISSNLKIERDHLHKAIRFFIYVVGVIAWIFFAIALSGPRSPLDTSKNKIEVMDIFFVVDVSRSMLAEDFKPNRVEAAKSKIREFVELKPADRVGIIMFSEKLFTLLPLSTDLQLVKRIVEEIKVGFLGTGTNIGDAIGLAVARSAYSIAKSKVVILLTDGVSNVGNITPLKAANEAKKYGIKIYTIGMGGDKNAKIPMGRKLFGKTQYQYIPGGSIDVNTLKQIARITKAKSYVAKDGNALKNILLEIEKLERTEIDQSQRIIYKEMYHKYLLVGVVLLTLVELSRKLLVREIA